MEVVRGIDSLPIELICRIFSLAISPQDAQTDRCRLTLVCRLWREYVEGSTLLWVDISARSDRAYIRRALERSKASVINLHWSAHIRTRMNLESFMAEAGPHIARWRSLTVAGRLTLPSWENALGTLTTAQAPRLESLDLSVVGSGRSVPQNAITLFGGAPAPSTLKHLTLKRVSVEVEPLSLSGLLSLHLTRVANISTLQLLEILRNSQMLQTLSMEDLAGIGSQSLAIPSIELPQLVSLKLEWIAPEGANCILSKIRIPNRRQVYICAGIEVSVRSVLFTPTIAHILHTTSPSPEPRSSDIIVKAEISSGCVIQFRGMELEIYMDGEGVDGEDEVQEILGWLVEGLGSEAAACPVRLMIDWSNMDPLRLATVPSPLFIKHLSIPDSKVFGSFAQPRCVATHQPPEPPSSGWSLTQMESLSIGFDTIGSQKEFISMLRNRYEATPGIETIGRSRCPMSLKSVELRGGPRNEGLVEEIRGILGEVHVFWRSR
ncbi:hypothetical protein M407DRAFT_30669 [Tulasnella calospora MUT 4182]|uniref:F-box domain-containing protein n=1 Tax=Tulasnella calospora MUT 4182 TaxID=1051891 RepID=A0A0C3Q7T3_9AGAM|nr:hypothetical protein M407DRAFT_30669 [Tulasnella calospora MUT 4182]